MTPQSACLCSVPYLLSVPKELQQSSSTELLVFNMTGHACPDDPSRQFETVVVCTCIEVRPP